MTLKTSKLGLFLAGSYSLLVLTAAGWMVYVLVVRPANSELVGVPLILLTQPWCLFLFKLMNALHFNDRAWPVSLALLLACAALNAFILYKIGAALSSQVIQPVEKKRSQPGMAGVLVYASVALVAIIHMTLAIQARANPGWSILALMVASEPWSFLVSILIKLLGATGLKWVYFLPMPAGLLVNGFVVYALSASIFKKKLNAPNPTNV